MTVYRVIDFILYVSVSVSHHTSAVIIDQCSVKLTKKTPFKPIAIIFWFELGECLNFIGFSDLDSRRCIDCLDPALWCDIYVL